jgi:hypothetical protein
MITTTRTTYTDGRTYEVVADSDKYDQSFAVYAQVYRVRKDGTRGRRFVSDIVWRVYTTVSDQVDAAQGRTPKRYRGGQTLQEIIRDGVRR